MLANGLWEMLPNPPLADQHRLVTWERCLERRRSMQQAARCQVPRHLGEVLCFTRPRLTNLRVELGSGYSVPDEPQPQSLRTTLS